VTQASTIRVSAALAMRSLVNVFRVPGAFVPVLVMPLFFLVSFSGSFSSLTKFGIVPTDNIFNWVAPYAIIQGAAFAGMGATFSVARDLEGGFYDRFLLAPTPRRALITGPLLSALLRALLPFVIVGTVAMLAGARFTSGLVGVVPLLVAIEGTAVLACLWGLGIVFRFKSQRSIALVQVAIFASTFLSAAQVPVGRMVGWVKPIAQVNPVTNIIRLAREGLLPNEYGLTWHNTVGGVLALSGAAAALAWFAVRGMRRLIP
jgi:ABC-2 type transport system permease protein